jgi:hypothetical protein
MTAKFGTSFADADGNAATPLKSFSLTIDNGVLLDEAFLSCSNEIAAGSLVRGPLKVSGAYTLHFADTVELTKYQANTKNALIVAFAGASIGTAATEQIQIKLGKLVLTDPPIEYSADGLLVLNQKFEVEYDATDGDITIVVTNEQANASGARYNPA